MSERLSLKAKLPLYASMTMALVIVVLSALAFQEVRRAQLEAARERLQRITAQFADLTTLANDARLALADSIASSPDVVALFSDPSPAAQDRGRTALAVALDTLGARAFEIRTVDGARLMAGPGVPVPSLEPTLDTVPRTTRLVNMGDTLVSAMTAPVRDGDEILGVIAFWRETARLQPAGRRVLQDLVGVDTRILLGSVGGGWTDLFDIVGPPPAEQLALAADPERAGELLQYERAGEEVYAVAATLEGVPWLLVAELPEETVLAPARAFLLRLLLLSPIALLGVAMSVWLLGRTISRSLEETARAAEAIAAGETGQRVPVRGDDELGRLARSFNTMAQQIEDTQAAMSDVNASLVTMIDGAPLPIVVLDLEGRVRIWNKAAERSFGWAAADVVGELMPLAQPNGAALELPTGADGAHGAEFRVVNRDGAPMDLFIAVAPTYSSTGKIDGSIVACDDITARKMAEAQLERYAEELARSNAELENFAYVASHDLREPLRMVRSFTGLLSDRYADALDEDAERYIAFARDGAQRMEELIKALLEYSRVDGDRDAEARVSSREALDEALRMLEPSIRESNAKITVGDLPEVFTNRSQLLRVFQNLIGNAIKFRGDAAPDIRISAERQGDEWIFSVRDNGIGIDPAYHDRVFQIFKRLHGLDEYGGTGMGLSICKKIIESQGGAIWVDSREGEGSCFYFTLRAAVARVA